MVDRAEERSEAGETGGANLLVAGGGVLSALGAMSCCVLPFLLFTVGVGGAWIGNLTALAPYQPLFVAGAVGFIGLGYWRAFWRRQPACGGGSCARPASARLTKAGLVVATAMVVASVGVDLWAPLFY
jgi:mercuric ion transport protein